MPGEPLPKAGEPLPGTQVAKPLEATREGRETVVGEPLEKMETREGAGEPLLLDRPPDKLLLEPPPPGKPLL